MTIGTTALSASNLGALCDDENLQREAQDFLDGTAPSPDFFQRVLDAHDLIWLHGLSVFEHRNGTSAEMASSWYALRIQGNEHLFHPDRDRIVLLSSETPQGIFCARINEQLMRRYLFHPAAQNPESACVEVIAGLEAKKGGFASNIVDSIEAIWSRHQALDETMVNITGGFKGTVPALTWRCMNTENSSMFYTYESMDRAETITFFKEAAPKYNPIIIPRK